MITKEKYVQVMPPDTALIKNAFHQARHFRTLFDFSFECGYTPRTFYHAALDADKTYKDRMLRSVGIHAAKESGLDEERMMAAGGKIKGEYIERIYRHSLGAPVICRIYNEGLFTLGDDGSIIRLPGEETREYVRYIDHYQTVLTKEQMEAEKYVSYVEDLIYFCLPLNDELTRAAISGARSHYQDQAFVYMLKQYRELRMAEKRLPEPPHQSYDKEDDHLSALRSVLTGILLGSDDDDEQIRL